MNHLLMYQHNMQACCTKHASAVLASLSILTMTIVLPGIGLAAPLGSHPTRNPFMPYTVATSPVSHTATVPSGNAGAMPAPQAPAPPAPIEETIYTILPLNYVQAQDILGTVQGLGFANVAVDKATNSLLVKGSEQMTRDLQTLVKKLDQATPQVTLEAKIIAINRENSKDLGVNWAWDTIPQRKSNTNTSNDDTDSDDFGGRWKVWHGYAFHFNATLNALIAQGKARILATPHIITIPGREANIFIGDHIPVQTEKHTSSSTYTATEYVDAGIKLQYTPIISQDGKMVTAAVHTEVSTPTLVSELKNYRVTSRTADTNVRMYSGETLVIGGLINEEEQKTLQQVPLLSKIPLLGELFKNRTTKRSKVEVMMLLTPHITEAGKSPVIYEDKAQELLETKVLEK